MYTLFAKMKSALFHFILELVCKNSAKNAIDNIVEVMEQCGIKFNFLLKLFTAF
jgi:hypothetical protein